MARDTIVIFRLGSLGDTVNCLPCFHQIVRAFPDARRILLTNIPVSSIAAPSESILRDGGFIHDVVRYAVGERDLRALAALRRALKALNADTLIYLTEGRSLWSNWRDWMFFRLCGFKRLMGVPLRPDLAHGRRDRRTGEVEREVERLARCLAPLGPLDLQDKANWDLNLTGKEKAAGDVALEPLGGAPFIAINTGGKVKTKDWGEANWTALLTKVSQALPGHGLVFIGAAEDSERAGRLAGAWSGPTLDQCGRLSPRGSGAVMRRGALHRP
jgi:ADP-heptose:LPS heptosyltransferase